VLFRSHKILHANISNRVAGAGRRPKLDLDTRVGWTLRTSFPAPPLTYNVSKFEAKARHWRRGTVRSQRCGDFEPYWGTNTLERALQDVYELAISSGVGLSAVMINVGAGDGIGRGQSKDPVWDIGLKFNLSVVFMEPDDGKYPVLLDNIARFRPADQVRSEALKAIVTPALVPELIASSPILRGLRSVDILKVDIDSADCDVAAQFLRWHQVRLLFIEVNPLPPPIMFSQHSSETPWPAKPLHGCSLSYMVDLFARFDMWVYRYDGQDAMFVDAEMVQVLSQQRGEQFPIDEIDCFRRPPLLPSTQAGTMDELRHWFFNLDAGEQLVAMQTRALQEFVRQKKLCFPATS